MFSFRSAFCFFSAYVTVSPESTITTYTKTVSLYECGGVLAEICLPDYNGDNITDLRDFSILASVYGMSKDEEGWKETYDITGNGTVSKDDLDYIKDMIFAGLFGAEEMEEEQVSDHQYYPSYEIKKTQKTRTLSYVYDSFGNVAELTDYNGNKITYTYDSCGRVVSVTDQAGAESKLEYDTMGNPVKVILPEGVTESYTYDSEGRLLTVTGRRCLLW